MTNHLAHEKSLYLQQHKTNPVHWYAWGERAFQKAKKEKKPVFVSIGYSSCHWCHVMAHESFEDEEVAELLNTKFVAIKVDKEEYPDVDAFYMDFMSRHFGHGGWPLHVFVNGNKTPFFAMTYAPKQQCMQMLKNLAEEFAIKPLLQQQTITNNLQVPQLHHRKVQQLLNSIEQPEASSTTGPQFPQAAYLLYQLRRGLTKKFEGDMTNLITKGLFDHIEGGWFRYTVDPHWTIPHFEKMLYDQGPLLLLCAAAYEKCKLPMYRYAIEKTVQWVRNHMQLPTGLYGSATNADTEEGEGFYYTIPKTSDTQVIKLFRLKEAGVHEGRIVPWINLEKQANRQTQSIIRTYVLKRKQLDHPELDTKSVMSWNCFLAYSLLRCGAVLKDKKIKDSGIALFEAITALHVNTSFHHIVYDKAGFPGHLYLEDYAAYLLLLTEIPGTSASKKTELLTKIIQTFVVDDECKSTNHLLFNTRNLWQDSPFPSGQSMLLQAAKKLNSSQRERIRSLTSGIADLAAHHPTFFGFWLQAYQQLP